MKRLILIIIAIFAAAALSGCGTLQKIKKADQLEIENSNLRRQMLELERERDRQLKKIQRQMEDELAGRDTRIKELSRKKAQEIDKLKQAKDALDKDLAEYKAKLEMTERGLVITFLAEVFFESGKDDVKEEGQEALSKVAEVLNSKVPNTYILIEGHTDNVPIKYSGWKSNWELSSARALAVLHYLIDSARVRPQRLSACGYGEFRPVADNSTPEARQQNRRVEIVIVPEKIKKMKTE